MMPWQHFGQTSSLCCEAAALNPDDVRVSVIPPNPLFKGAHQASVRTGDQGNRFAVLRPASEDALVVLRTLLLRFV